MNNQKPVNETRRKLVAGAAWSVPVIALAVAAPSAAASTLAPSFVATVAMSLAGQPGSRGNITVNSSSMLLTGPAGTTTGRLEVKATAPAGYTISYSQSLLNGWTAVKGQGSSEIIEFTHPGFSLATEGTMQYKFPDFTYVGTGATSANFGIVEVWSSEWNDLLSSKAPGSRG